MIGALLWRRPPLLSFASGLLFLASGLMVWTPVHAYAATDRSAIEKRLTDWATAFNRKDSAAVCDLFASDLVQTVPGMLEGNRDDVCGRLDRLLAQTDKSFSYAVDIREIIVSGDIAVVRLFWTLTVLSGQGPADINREAGIDVFRREQDGKWRIIRFIAFTENDAK